MTSNGSALSSIVANSHQAIHYVSSAPSIQSVRRVFVIRHGVGVQAGFLGVGTAHALWRRSGRRVVPGTEVAKDLLGHARVVNDGKNPHRVLTDGTAQRVNMPNAQDDLPPLLGGQFYRRRR